MGDKPKQVMFPYEEIREIHKRRHLLKNNALEIFLLNGKTYLLAFEKMSDRDSVYDKVLSRGQEEKNKICFSYSFCIDYVNGSARSHQLPNGDARDDLEDVRYEEVAEGPHQQLRVPHALEHSRRTFV